MGKNEALVELEQKALVIVSIKDRRKRNKGGMHLEALCRSVDEQYRIINGLDHDAEVRLRAVLKILFEHILHDAYENDEDEDWGIAEAPRISPLEIIQQGA